MSVQKNRRILVVDDEPISLKMAASTLNDAGYEIATCDNGEQAWELLQTDQAFDVIILDRLMPGMDGMELFKKLHHDERLTTIPVIMLTGVDESVEIINAIEEGVFDYLTKPVNQKQLLDLIEKTLS